MNVNELWQSPIYEVWKNALDKYWSYIKPKNLELEKWFYNLDSSKIEILDSEEWYEFLLNNYFVWKYTAKNRYVTTTKYFKKYKEHDELNILFDLKKELFSFDKRDITKGLSIKIKGLGVAGQSGLLSVLFPKYFGTVDQFVVKSLRKIEDFPKNEKENLLKMNPESLKIKDGVVLISILRKKSSELNNMFNTDFWTPRKIDMVLWAVRE